MIEHGSPEPRSTLETPGDTHLDHETDYGLLPRLIGLRATGLGMVRPRLVL